MRLRRTAATGMAHTEHITVAEEHDEPILEAETVAEHEDESGIMAEETHETVLAMPQLPQVEYVEHNVGEGEGEVVNGEAGGDVMEISTVQHYTSEMVPHEQHETVTRETDTTTDQDAAQKARPKASTARGRGGVRATKKPTDFADLKSYEEYMHRRTLNNEQCRIHRRRKKEELEKMSHQVSRLTMELHEARVEIQGLKGELAATKSLLSQATKEINVLRGGGGGGGGNVVDGGVAVAGGVNVVSSVDGVGVGGEVEESEEQVQEQGGSGRTLALGSNYVNIAAATPVYPSGPGYPPPGAWMKA